MSSSGSRNLRGIRVVAIVCCLAIAISALLFNWNSMPSEAGAQTSADTQRDPVATPHGADGWPTALEGPPPGLGVNASADQLLGKMRDLARRTAVGYGPQVLRELQHFPIGIQFDVLISLWREGFAEVGEALQDISITCAAHANAVASGYDGPEYARFLSPFAKTACRDVLNSYSVGELSATVNEIQRRWQSDSSQLAVETDPNAEPYTAEEHTALLGRSEHESELTLRMTAVMSAAPSVLLGPEALANFSQLPQARRAHIAHASTVLASCSIFGSCSPSSITAFDFCTSPGVVCVSGESVDLSVRRNLSSVELQLALDAVNRASALRDAYARAAGRTGP